MAAERLSMRKLREILRLAALGQSRRAIGRSLNISHNTVGTYLDRALTAGVSWRTLATVGTRRVNRIETSAHQALRAAVAKERAQVRYDVLQCFPADGACSHATYSSVCLLVSSRSGRPVAAWTTWWASSAT